MTLGFSTSLPEGGTPLKGWPDLLLPDVLWPPMGLVRARRIEIRYHEGDDSFAVAGPISTAQGIANVPLEEEFHLRELLDANLDDQKVVGGLVQHYGFLLDRDPSRAPRKFNDVFGHFGRISVRNSGVLNWIETKRAGVEQELGPDQPFELLVESRILLKWLRDLTRMWIAYAFTGNVVHDDLPWESEEVAGIPKPKDEMQGRILFETGLSAAMAEFHPIVRMSGWDKQLLRKNDDIREAVMALDMDLPSFFSLIARQLYNHVAERATLRECANETCSQIFVRQVRGGSAPSSEHAWKYSPNTKGVKFCSRRCAKTQTTREWRREQRNKKQAAEKSKGSTGQERTN